MTVVTHTISTPGLIERAIAGPHRAMVDPGIAKEDRMTEDLSELIVPHWSHGAPPSPALDSRGAPAQYGQGVLVEWNPATFENVVRFRGTELRDLPVMAGISALAFAPGDVVSIMHWAPQGGAGSYWLMPQVVVPGSGAAERAVAAMRTQLARQVAASIFAERIHTATVAEAGVRGAFGTFGDLTATGTSVPSPGPEVTVDISPARRALVILTAAVTAPAPVQGGGDMSVAVSGASTIGPNQATRALSAVLSDSNGGTTLYVQASATALITADDGLNEGMNTFTAKYRDPTGVAPEASWQNRTLTVIGF